MKSNKLTFMSSGRFYYKNNYYEIFHNENNKIAILRISEDGAYHYPTIEEFSELTLLFNTRKNGVLEIKRDMKGKKKRFIPKILVGGGIIALTTITSQFLWQNGIKDYILNKNDFVTFNFSDENELSASERAYRDYCEKYNIDIDARAASDVVYSPSQEVDTKSFVVESVSSTTIENEEKNDSQNLSESNVHENENTNVVVLESEDELENKYLSFFAMADDDLDYSWKNDYIHIESANYTKVSDSKAYETIFGFAKPSINDIKQVVMSNSNISNRYKNFILEFATDYLDAYPDTDFSVFLYNLKNLIIHECTQDEIMMAALSPTALACYRTAENAIYINENANIEDKFSDDYIIASHELLHAARGTTVNQGDYKLRVGFYENTDFGYYLDETLDTYFVYNLQGLGSKPTHYTISSNYLRIWMDCLGDSYTGSDYMNHSINYFAQALDMYNGDEMYAYHILAQLESLNILYYTPYTQPDYSSFEDLNNYTLRMYMSKHLSSDSTYEQAMEAFNDFMAEITFNFENLTLEVPDITEESFMGEFENILQELNISKQLTR